MISIAPLPGNLRMNNPAALIATGLGSGRLAPAPGTWGSLAAWGIALLLGMDKILIAAAFVAAIIAGLWAIQTFQAVSGDHDNRMIVIDEWAGQWLALLLAAPYWDQLILALILFRVFDILKPWPIGWLDRNLKGAWGVMTDDLAAGLAAGLCVYGYGLWMLS